MRRSSTCDVIIRRSYPSKYPKREKRSSKHPLPHKRAKLPKLATRLIKYVVATVLPRLPSDMGSLSLPSSEPTDSKVVIPNFDLDND